MFYWENCGFSFFSFSSFSFLSADAASPQCDVAEELSRQLEDILSTYCRESISDDAGALLNGQSHSPVLNGLTSEKENDKQEEGKVGNGGAEKEQKKTQEKKKVKGLGKKHSIFIMFKEFMLFHIGLFLSSNRTLLFAVEFCLFSSGKEITLLMQTLNTLSTPEEKLAGLCKKYADLVSSSCRLRSF